MISNDPRRDQCKSPKAKSIKNRKARYALLPLPGLSILQPPQPHPWVSMQRLRFTGGRVEPKKQRRGINF